MRVGELNIINSIIGNGDGLAAKDLLIATSVTAQVVNVEQNTEVLTAEPGQINN
jgi:predicted membrane-bound spermidine synthase